jgi:hypothetical protein
MASKYAGVIDQLPKMLNTEPAYQEKVNAVKLNLAGEFASASALASEYVMLRGEEDQLDEQLSSLHLRMAAIEQMTTEQFEAEGATSMKLVSGHSLSVQVEPYTRVVDKDATRLWAIANGLERSLALPWQTLNAISKERLLAGEPGPDGTELSARTKLVLRKG